MEFEFWKLKFEIFKLGYCKFETSKCRSDSFRCESLELLNDFQQLALEISTFKGRNFELWNLELWSLRRWLLNLRNFKFWKLKLILWLQNHFKVHGFYLGELHWTQIGWLDRFSWSLKKTKEIIILAIDVSRKTTFWKHDFFGLFYVSFSP